ncbi:FKBP-type peptidyl-prolyl cis-trans isomerase [Mucilaginibacter sp.]
MKQTIFTLLLLSTIGFMSCRKNGVEQTIAQYDQTQIQSYIKSNNLTGMQKDTVGGDTSGIYYQILSPGTGTPLVYTDQISFVFTLKSLDGLYTTSDTIANHFFGYVGHIASGAIPPGVEIAILNDLKYSGGRIRMLIPSQLGFGKAGYGSGSINISGSHIAGNQSLDIYVHIISKQTDMVYGTNTFGYQYSYNKAQEAYDEQVIQNYIPTTGITYVKAPSVNLPGTNYWYSIRTPGTGTDTINQNSTITANFYGRLLDNQVFTQHNNSIADTTSLDVPALAKGVQEALSHTTTGSTVSMIFPSALGYGEVPQSADISVPVNSCLRFEFEVRRVYP